MKQSIIRFRPRPLERTGADAIGRVYELHPAAESVPAAAQNPPSTRKSAACRPALFVGSPMAPRPALTGRNHPLAISRVSAVQALARVLGWLDEDCFRQSPEATVEALAGFHTRPYLAALRHADATQHVDASIRDRYCIGNFENPVFPGVFRQAALAVGGSIEAADLALEGFLPFHPAGGTHHGRSDRASGFCYFNDPVFAIRRLLERGVERVAYVDIDAHHGDGVEDAFAGDVRVRPVSIHEAGRWPHSGARAGRTPGGAYNLPVPQGLNDSEFEFLLTEAVLPRVDEFAPGAIVVTCGADGLAGDPLARMELSNLALWTAVDRIRALGPATVVLGGGGYNPWTVARCWTGLWGRLSGRTLPELLPPDAQALLAGLACDLVDEDEILPEWTSTLSDAPREGMIRSEVREVAAAAARD
jgi:acetoin utilization protein AcuC